MTCGDRLGDGCVTAASLSDFLKRLKIFANQNEVRALMRRFDTQGNGRFSVSEFVNEIATPLLQSPDARQDRFPRCFATEESPWQR